MSRPAIDDPQHMLDLAPIFAVTADQCRIHTPGAKQHRGCDRGPPIDMAQQLGCRDTLARSDGTICLDQLCQQFVVGFGVNNLHIAVKFEAQTKAWQLLLQYSPPGDDDRTDDPLIQPVLNCTQHAFILALAIGDTAATTSRGFEHRQHQLRRTRVLLRQ